MASKAAFPAGPDARPAFDGTNLPDRYCCYPPRPSPRPDFHSRLSPPTRLQIAPASGAPRARSGPRVGCAPERLTWATAELATSAPAGPRPGAKTAVEGATGMPIVTLPGAQLLLWFS